LWPIRPRTSPRIVLSMGFILMAQSGKFRERVTFQSLTNGSGTTDKYGNALDSWGNDVERWADIIERPGRERIEGGALAGVNTATVRVRKDSITSQIGTGWRVYARGQYWDIESAIQVDRPGAVLEFMAQKGTAP